MNKELISSFRNIDTNQEFRTLITKEGMLYFCLSDICKSLNLTNPSSVKKGLVKEFGDGVSILHPIITPNRGQQLFTFISEAQMYFLIFRSYKKEARKFRDWLSKEVMPSLMKQYRELQLKSNSYSPFDLELLEKIDKLEREIKEAKCECNIFKQKLELNKQDLETASIRSELISLSSIADFYYMEESSLKSLLKNLGVDLSKSAFSNHSGSVTYVTQEDYNHICNALCRNFNKGEFCDYEDSAKPYSPIPF